MAEDLKVLKNVSREEQYRALMPQIQALVAGEDDFTANVGNVMAAIKETFQFFWVGCYFVKNEELVLGPFQGPVACTRIKKGKGVCGASWEKAKVMIVDDVDQFPGHIACSSLSKSEIVLPIFNKKGEIAGVLDVDSEQLAHFSAIDEEYLKLVVDLIGSWI